jgi:Dolichyl-phosphate-mannose-protein mannosyltransferase
MQVGGYMVAFATLVAVAGGGTLAGWLVVRRRLVHLRGGARAAALGLTVTAALIAVHVVPGAFGLLYPGVVAACAVLLALGCGLLPQAELPRPPSDAPEAPEPLVSRGLAVLAVGAVVVASLASLRVTGTRLPTAVDALSFHLPDVARWVQLHGLWHVEQFSPYLAPGNYPNNGDVLSLLAVLPFHDVALARFVFLPWLALTGVGVFSVARELGAPRTSAAVFAAAAVALPAVARSTIGFVDPDAVLYASFSAGLLFLLRHRRTGRRSDLVLAGLGLGLALGTKWYGLSSFAVVVGLWVLLRLFDRVRVARVAVDGALLGGVALLAGGFWLLRNGLLSGDPLFPAKVAIGGVTVFDAPPDVIRAQGGFTLTHYAGDSAILRGYVWPAFKASYGAAPIVLGLGALAAAWLARRRRRVPWLALVAAALALAYAVTPYSAQGPAGRPVGIVANARYGVPALLVAAALCAVAAGRLGRRRWVAEAVGAALALDGLRRAFTLPAHTVATMTVVVCAALAVAWQLRRAGGRRWLPVGGAAALLLVFGAAVRHVDTHADEAAWHTDAALAWMRTHAQAGHRVGLAGRWSNGGIAPVLPAFGRRLGNTVVYVGPFRRHMLSEYTAAGPFLARLRAEHVDLLLIGRGYPRPLPRTREESWARAAGMRLVAGSPRLLLYASGR